MILAEIRFAQMVETEQCQGFFRKLLSTLIREDGLTKYQEMTRIQALIRLMEDLQRIKKRVGQTGKATPRGDRKSGEFLFEFHF